MVSVVDGYTHSEYSPAGSHPFDPHRTRRTGLRIPELALEGCLDIQRYDSALSHPRASVARVGDFHSDLTRLRVTGSRFR